MGNHSSKKNISRICSSNDLTTREEINCLSIGFHARAVSYEALKKLTENLRDTNDQAAKVSKNNENLWKNTELDELGKDCFNNYWDTLHFCSALQSLQTTHENQSNLLASLEKIECQGQITYEKTLEDLKKFNDVDSLLLEELLRNLKSLYERESQMKTKLEHHNEIISKKYKSLHTWRRNATTICIGTCVGVVVCAIVAAAIAVPPVAAAAAVATTIPIGSVGKSITAVWKKHETKIKKHQKVSYAMEEMTGIVITDLKTIQKLIENLKADDQRPQKYSFMPNNTHMSLKLDDD